MQINKKAYTTFIIALLTLSVIITAIPMVSAVASAPGTYVPATTPVTALSSGPVGTKVCVVGNATHGAASPFSTVTFYWDNLAGAVLGSVASDAAGAYKFNVTIPSAVVGASHYIVAKDDGAAAGATFTVTTSLSASAVPPTMPPVRVLPGDTVTIKGNGYAANSAVTVYIENATFSVNITLTVPAITTNGTGSFEASIIVPAGILAANYGIYTIHATDAGTNTATASVTVDYYIIVTPGSGPTGITTTIAGRIPASTAYQLRFNAAQISTGTSGTDGTFSFAYTIPGVLSPASYVVDIVWATVNNRSTTFTVTSPPTITLGVSTGVAGLIVTVTGSGFSSLATITLNFGTTAVNSTAMATGFGPTTFMGALPAGLTFVVPTLTPGAYAVNVVDQYGATSAAGVVFTIAPTPTTSITLRGTSYYPGDIFSFNIRTTESSLGSINVTIYDPTGAIFWRSEGDWSLTLSDDGTYRSVIFQNQGADNYNQMRMMLPADAPLGSWNWTIKYTPASTSPVAAKATGLFTVAALPTMQTVLDRLDVLNANITSIVTTAKGDIIAVINTKSGQITTSLSALDPKLQGIEDTVVIIATMLGEVQVDIAALDFGTMGADITSIKNGMATIQTSIGTVTAGVSALDAKVSTISGDVATVKTTVATLQGKITAIDGNVATIETSVGTIQADVSEVKAKPDVDMTPVWIAVVLSLIAAIAAIFAVVTIRQKIAG